MKHTGHRSLQFQLALRLAALFIAATAIAVGVLVYQAYSTAESLSDQDLYRRAADLARLVSTDRLGEARLDLPAKLSSAYGSPAETFLFAVRGPDGRLISASQSATGDLVSGWPKAGEDTNYFRLEGFGRSGQDYYGLTARFMSQAGPLSVTVARAANNDELVHSVLREFVLDMAWTIPLVLAAVLLIAILGIRRGLYPLRKVSALAVGRSRQSIDALARGRSASRDIAAGAGDEPCS